MEALPGLRVRLLTQSHGKGPGSFSHHQGNVQIPNVGFRSGQVGSRHVALFEVPLVRLRQFEDLPDSTQSTRAVAPIALVVSEADAMLLLPITDQAEDCKEGREWINTMAEPGLTRWHLFIHTFCSHRLPSREKLFFGTSTGTGTSPSSVVMSMEWLVKVERSYQLIYPHSIIYSESQSLSDKYSFRCCTRMAIRGNISEAGEG